MSKLLLFNKPYNVVCQFSSNDSSELTLANFITLPGYYPAGRLDKNSEGLLLLTNDGKLQHQLSHPNYQKKKYYWVQVDGIPTDADLTAIRQGITASEIYYKPAQVEIIAEPVLWPRIPPIRVRKSLPTSWLEIILTEGKNHQIRKITAAIGFPTLRLVRHRIADWSLEKLSPGEHRMVTISNNLIY